MINQYALMKLCDKYHINYVKLISGNNKIFDVGEYDVIDRTLDYLINVLNISPSNIEKCSSVLYNNVDFISGNVEFLNNCRVDFYNVESCLHILSTNPAKLKETYEYVLANYGVEAINDNTSILAVDVETIKSVEKLNIKIDKKGNLLIAKSIYLRYTTLEEVKSIIQSREYLEHPELFTSTTLAQSNIRDIRDIISSDEFKNYPHLFTSTTLAHSNIRDIREIISSEEFKNYPHLFTSTTLAHANIKDIQEIINSEEFKKYPELFTSETLAFSNIRDIRDIIGSEEFKKYPELFTSTTLAFSNIRDIRDIIGSEEFKNYPHLFTSQTLAYAKIADMRVESIRLRVSIPAGNVDHIISKQERYMIMMRLHFRMK